MSACKRPCVCLHLSWPITGTLPEAQVVDTCTGRSSTRFHWMEWARHLSEQVWYSCQGLESIIPLRWLQVIGTSLQITHRSISSSLRDLNYPKLHLGDPVHVQIELTKMPIQSTSHMTRFIQKIVRQGGLYLPTQDGLCLPLCYFE